MGSLLTLLTSKTFLSALTGIAALWYGHNTGQVTGGEFIAGLSTLITTIFQRNAVAKVQAVLPTPVPAVATVTVPTVVTTRPPVTVQAVTADADLRA